MSKSPFNWKLFFVLLAGAIFGLVAIIPYSLALQGDAVIAAVAEQLAMPLWALIAIQIAQQVVLFAVAIWVGMSFAKSVGLGAPLLEKRLAGGRVGAELKRILPISIGLGVFLALLLIALEIYIFQPALVQQLGPNELVGNSANKPEAWKGFLASFYGGINEEILLRLCVMSFLVWLGRLVSKTSDGRPTLAVLWIANILAAALFGVGHLPATAMLVPLTSLVVTRALVLNGLIGIGFGYLYFKRGLESAMISHFSADLILHVLFAV
jgi:membrane protease YdiL (CAAX protease family)